MRFGVGVVLGVMFLGEILILEIFVGICFVIVGVVLINWIRKLK